MYAIISTGGKQYRVSEGDVIFIEKLEAQQDEEVKFENVLAVGKDDGIVAGTPTVAGAVFTYRPKKGSARKMGHRQPYTKVEIGSIQA